MQVLKSAGKVLLLSFSWAFILSTNVAAQYGANVDGEWSTYGGDLGNTKYSPLDQIDENNFSQLRIAWEWESADRFLSKSYEGGGELWTDSRTVFDELTREDPNRWRDQESPYLANFKATPLMVGGKQIGIYVLHGNKAKADFTLGEIQLLDVLSNQTAVAIENSRLYTDLESAHASLKESQRQLLLSAKQAAIGELAGGVAHEVNNPLQIILSRVQLMISKQGNDPKAVDGLRLIENNVRRISKIIRALLGFASDNTEESAWTMFHVSAPLNQACTLVRHQLESNLIDIKLEITDDLPMLHGNVGELEQVFINLVLNAQNAMPDGGHIVITTSLVAAEKDHDILEIRFTDTGIGIDHSHLDRIFQPFFTTHPDDGGTGLGLAVSYRIIETHLGSITVESEPGNGTTFIIRLPISVSSSKEFGDAALSSGISPNAQSAA